MTAVHASAVPSYLTPKIVAVSAVQRHTLDYFGPLKPNEMADQAKSLQKDPNSLHFLTENHRGEVRMAIIDVIVQQKMIPPQAHTDWFVPDQGVQAGARLCTENLGVGCFTF